MVSKRNQNNITILKFIGFSYKKLHKSITRCKFHKNEHYDTNIYIYRGFSHNKLLKSIKFINKIVNDRKYN